MKFTFHKAINTLFLITVFLFSFGQIGRLAFFNENHQVNIYLYEILLAITIGVFFLKYRLEPFKEKIAQPLLLFFGYLLLSFLFNTFRYSFQENLIAILYLFRLILYGFYFVYLLFYFRENQRDKILYWCLLIISTIIITTSFIQYFLYPDLRNLFYLGWDPHLYRMFGLFLEPVVAAAVYGLLAIWFMSIDFVILGNEVTPPGRVQPSGRRPESDSGCVHDFRSGLTRMTKYLVIFLLVLMILLTYSRGAYVGLIGVVLVFSIKKKYYIPLLIFLALFIFSLILLPKKFGEGVNLFRTSTIESRLTNYQEAFGIWQESPMIGIGYNHIRSERLNYSLNDVKFSHSGASFHSSFLIILVTGGIIGLGLFVYLLFSLARLNSVSFYVVIYLSILSFVDNVLLHPFVLFLFFTILSILRLNCQNIRLKILL